MLRLYVDTHVRREITEGLRARGVDVPTAQEDGRAAVPDDQLLSRAIETGRALFSQDSDLLSEAARCQRAGSEFSGLIYAHQLKVTIGQCIDDLELLAKAYEPAQIMNQVIYLPL